MGIFKSGLNLIPPVLQLENYYRAWVVAGFNKYMLNSVIVTLGTVLIVLVTASMAGYIIGRYHFFGKKIIVALIMGAVFVPTGVTIIPTFNLADFLGILDSLFGVIIVLSGSGHVVDILLFTAFFKAIPNELEEAAIWMVPASSGFFTRSCCPCRFLLSPPVRS